MRVDEDSTLSIRKTAFFYYTPIDVVSKHRYNRIVAWREQVFEIEGELLFAHSEEGVV
jgi:hypothetical protein